MVIHDADVKRTTNGEGLVSELTLEEIKSFKMEKDERILTLKEALDFLDEKVKKNSFAKFHTKQAINLIVFNIAFSLLFSILSGTIVLIPLVAVAMPVVNVMLP